MVIVLIFIVVLICFILRAAYEMRHMKVSTYDISSEKIPRGQSGRFVFLTDLHQRTYGKNNIDLIARVKSLKPDWILLGGDMVTASPEKKDDVITGLLKGLSEIAPVFYAPGNHEKDIEIEPQEFKNRFEILLKACEESNVKYLSNAKEDAGEHFSVTGLDVDFKYYKRINTPRLTGTYLKETLPSFDKTRYNILLAHNPGDFEVYETMGLDLVLSGHFHGGVIRLPFGRGFVTPRFVFNSNYTWGTFIKNNTRMIVSAGIGSHKVNIRLFNKPEIVLVNIHAG